MLREFELGREALDHVRSRLSDGRALSQLLMALPIESGRVISWLPAQVDLAASSFKHGLVFRAAREGTAGSPPPEDTCRAVPPPFQNFPWDPTQLGPDWEWRGSGPVESGKGNFYNPITKESLHPDFDSPHGPPEELGGNDDASRWWTSPSKKIPPPPSWIQLFIAGFLTASGQRFAIFENAVLRAHDSHPPEDLLFTYGSDVFYFLTSKTVEKVAEALDWVDFGYFVRAILTEPKEALSISNRQEVSAQTLHALVDGTEAIIVDAFDAEAHIVWMRA